MWIWLGLGILIGGMVAAVTAYLIQRRREPVVWHKHICEIARLERQSMDLVRENFELLMELEEERYRHDRVQDFCVKVCDQLDAAKKELKHCSSCFTCKRNGVSCHVEQPIVEPDVCCGRYRWRGEADCRVADAPRNDSECGKQELHWNFPSCKTCKRGDGAPCKYWPEQTLYCCCSHYERLLGEADG